MYCDEVQLEADTVLATLYVAKKYIVPHLARACVNYLETSLTAKNACLLLSQSRLFEEPDLMQRCWEVIDAQVSDSDNTNSSSLDPRADEIKQNSNCPPRLLELGRSESSSSSSGSSFDFNNKINTQLDSQIYDRNLDDDDLLFDRDATLDAYCDVNCKDMTSNFRKNH